MPDPTLEELLNALPSDTVQPQSAAPPPQDNELSRLLSALPPEAQQADPSFVEALGARLRRQSAPVMSGPVVSGIMNILELGIDIPGALLPGKGEESFSAALARGRKPHEAFGEGFKEGLGEIIKAGASVHPITSLWSILLSDSYSAKDVGNFAVDATFDLWNLVGGGVMKIAKNFLKVGKRALAAETLIRAGATADAADDFVRIYRETPAQQKLDEIISVLEPEAAAQKVPSARDVPPPLGPDRPPPKIPSEKPIVKKKVGKSKDKQFPTEIRQVLDEFRKENADYIEAARRGIVPIEETQKAAKILEPRIAERMAKGIDPGEGVNETEAMAMARVAYRQLGSIIDDMVQGRNNKIVEQIFAARSTAGRTLRILRERPEGMEKMVELARKKLAEIGDPLIREQVEEMLTDLGLAGPDISPTRIAKFVEWATAIKLTGLSTQVKNTVGNVGEMLIALPERAVAGTMNAAAHALSGVDRTVYAREAFAQLAGLRGSLARAKRRFIEVIGDESKAFAEATKAAEVTTSFGAISETKGKIIRFPFRILAATDVFFKEMNRGAEIYSQVARKALRNGNYNSRAIRQVAEEIIAHPGEFTEIHKIADEVARQRVFQEALKGVAARVNLMRRDYPLLRLVMPFYNTPVNLLKRALRRTPGGTFVLPSDWKKFGYGARWRGKRAIYSRNSPEFYEMLAQQTIGSFALAGIGWWALEGRISGQGPRSRYRRSTMRFTGWQPNSVRIGNHWVSYLGFEPWSSWFRTMSDAVEAGKSGEGLEDIATGSMTSFMKQFSENPFLTGVNEIFEMMNDPEGPKVESFLASLAVGSTVPVILQQWGQRVFDPVIREYHNIPQRIASRLPFGPSRLLQPRLNIFGEVIRREYDGIPQALGFTLSLQRRSKLMNEILNLRDSEGNPISIGKPSREVAGIELSNAEYNRFLQLAGVMYKDSLSKLVNSPAYGRLSNDAKVRSFRETVLKINRIIRHEQFSRYYQGGTEIEGRPQTGRRPATRRRGVRRPQSVQRPTR